MSKTILGLDLGTNSIGWALVEEAETNHESSKIIKLGVRVIPLTVDEQTNFEKGKPISTNTERTLKRGARRNLQRYKLRRENLIEILISNKIINQDTPLTEIGKNTTHQTLMLRAKSAQDKVDLVDFAKILLAINKKRGYKSSRKSKSSDEGIAIDGMTVAKILYEKNITPGQYVYESLINGNKIIPDFYRSDLRNELKKIWDKQSMFYPTLLTNDLYHAIEDKNKSQTYKILESPWKLEGLKQSGKKDEQRLERYKWRQQALSEKIELEKLSVVLQEINNEINKSSGYLGAISDRSKILYLNKITVGEYLYNQILKNPHTSLKNKVFYRQDYLDEFEQIWETQAKHYPHILTKELKEEIRDVVIVFSIAKIMSCFL
jgi:CRISPR-associated endonuclease Csn1